MRIAITSLRADVHAVNRRAEQITRSGHPDERYRVPTPDSSNNNLIPSASITRCIAAMLTKRC
jgi:hypothetical protein